MPRSEPALVATCTPASGLHSSSRTTSSYRYFDLESALRSRTARAAELRPPRPMAELPPVSGPTKAMRTVSLARAEREKVAISAAAANLICASWAAGWARESRTHPSTCTAPVAKVYKSRIPTSEDGYEAHAPRRARDPDLASGLCRNGGPQGRHPHRRHRQGSATECPAGRRWRSHRRRRSTGQGEGAARRPGGGSQGPDDH